MIGIDDNETTSNDSEQSSGDVDVEKTNEGASVDANADTAQETNQGGTHTLNIGTPVFSVEGEFRRGSRVPGLVVGNTDEGKPIVGWFDNFTIEDEAKLEEV